MPSTWVKQAQLLYGARTNQAPSLPLALQLPQHASKPPEGPDWLHEIKWDG